MFSSVVGLNEMLKKLEETAADEKNELLMVQVDLFRKCEQEDIAEWQGTGEDSFDPNNPLDLLQAIVLKVSRTLNKFAISSS